MTAVRGTHGEIRACGETREIYGCVDAWIGRAGVRCRHIDPGEGKWEGVTAQCRQDRPREHNTVTQCWLNAGSASYTLAHQ